MAAAASSSSSPPPFSGDPIAPTSASIDDSFEDSCSICLEPFTPHNPSTGTICKHDYHLQCILEWSQRSKECPICWQLLVLKDPACQEHLAAGETERRLRSRNASFAAASSNVALEDFDVDQDSYSDDSDFDNRIMHRLTAITRRARRRVRQRYSGHDLFESHVPMYSSPPESPIHQQPHSHSSEEESYEATQISLPSMQTAASRDVPSKPRVFFRLSSGDASPEGSSFSESIKSKWFAASARYKESITKSKESINKSTQGIKEKLLAKNSSVKEISKGVQREMNAGIAGFARMMERLDLTQKRTGDFNPLYGRTEGTSNLSWKGKGMQEGIPTPALDKESEQTTHAANADVPSLVSYNVSGRVQVHPVQRDQ